MLAVGQFDVRVGPIGLVPADSVAGVAHFQDEFRRLFQIDLDRLGRRADFEDVGAKDVAAGDVYGEDDSPLSRRRLLVVVEADLATNFLPALGNRTTILLVAWAANAAGELLVDDFQRLAVAGVLLDRAVVHGDDQARLLRRGDCGAKNFAATKRRASAISSAVGLVSLGRRQRHGAREHEHRDKNR